MSWAEGAVLSLDKRCGGRKEIKVIKLYLIILCTVVCDNQKVAATMVDKILYALLARLH